MRTRVEGKLAISDCSVNTCAVTHVAIHRIGIGKRAIRFNTLVEAPIGQAFFASFASLAARFISCLCSRTLASDSGPVMSAAER